MSRPKQITVIGLGGLLLLLAVAWKVPENRSVAKPAPAAPPPEAAASAVSPENAADASLGNKDRSMGSVDRLPRVSEPPATLAGCIALLNQGREWLRKQPDYTATFRRQERVGGVLGEMETTELKFRNQPFSVTMFWLDGDDKGQIAHYQEGMDRDRVAVRMGGWKRRLGWLHIHPYSRLAMEESRYAITDVGMLKLADQWIERCEPYLDRTEGIHCRWEKDAVIGDRAARTFTIEYGSEAVNPLYRKSTVWLDKEWSAPLAVRNDDWQIDEVNPEGLMEYYVYEDVRFNRGLCDKDFAWQSADAPAVAATPD